MSNPFEQLQNLMADFSSQRDWSRFHSPKNLSMALTVEAAELQECFQWLTETQSTNLSEMQLAAVADEIADVQLYLVHLAATVGVDIETACIEKMVKNRIKYPVTKT